MWGQEVADGLMPSAARDFQQGRCASCAGGCPAGVRAERDRTHAVRVLFNSGRRVVALLASEYPAAFHPMSDGEIARALSGLGFAAVETTTLGEELVGEAYERLHARRDNLLSIRSTCPVVVEYVRSFYPAFVPALAPVVPAYVAQARLIRALNPEGLAIVYASPCHARKNDAQGPELAGAVDAVIGLDELAHMARVSRRRGAEEAAVLPRVHEVLRKEVSVVDGFPRRTLAERDLTDPCVAVVRGSAELGRLLAAISAGDAGPAIVDALECEGCLDGPAVPASLPLYARRTLVATRVDAPGAPRVSSRAVLRALPSVDLVRSFQAVPTTAACAPPRLRADGATWTRATGQRPEPPVTLRAVPDHTPAAAACAPRPGAADQTKLLTVLEHEVARHARYGSEVSLVLIGFADGAVTALGPGGRQDDGRLAAVMRRFASSVRSTDLLAPWGADGLALLLPATGKTAAFAVAEKLRTLSAEASVSGGYTPDVGVPPSFGIASAGPAMRDAATLVSAAAGVLEAAVATGPGQVRLAAG